MKKTTNLLVAALMGFAISASAQATQKPEVNQRLQNQNARIANGKANGQVTPAQAHALHAKDNAIHQEVRNDRAANGGHLTPQEKAKVNRQENHVSNQIHNEKHPNHPVH
jgi:hypothetical protein